jgi:hypothetical protein
MKSFALSVTLHISDGAGGYTAQTVEVTVNAPTSEVAKTAARLNWTAPCIEVADVSLGWI